jgi:hypothetical protein
MLKVTMLNVQSNVEMGESINSIVLRFLFSVVRSIWQKNVEGALLKYLKITDSLKYRPYGRNMKTGLQQTGW